MDHKHVAVCKKHAGKGLDDAVGRRSPKNFRVSRVTDPAVNRGQYFCYCGKPADFYIAEVEDGKAKKNSDSSQANPNAE